MERRGKNQTNDATLNEFDDDTSEFSMNILNHPNTDVLVSPIKVGDHDFNNFINNKCLDYSIESSLDITTSNLTTLKSKGQQKINKSNHADQNGNNNMDEKIKKNTILVNKEEKNKKGDANVNVAHENVALQNVALQNAALQNVEEENNLTRNKGNFKYAENFSGSNNNHYGSRVIQKSKHTQDYRKDGSYEQEEIER
ncbi:hypothetical protein PFDG_01169 [Plasmodium falciparum Dd2]|uniref:Uncharacterized protein n=1 Tax=Plasmodium falciparum (isolate Dd2) TaxID=57267 RepID=A0A0L7LYM6_PLAF4|nr:hypothetical protein PFDG_01169 [Plasmodium falciparum Dd2]